MRKIKTLVGLALTTLLLSSCGGQSSKAAIVTTLFPQFDLARAVAGDKKSVSLLTPLGSEVHGYEPTSGDIMNIKKAELFLYTSNAMERWVKNTITDGVNALNLENAYTKTAFNDDLHYWTDPVTMLELLDVIKTEIINLDSGNTLYYENNAQSYMSAINAVHLDLIELFQDTDEPTVFFYGHNALAPFARRYNFKISALSDNYQPDAELTVGQKLALKEKIKEANVKYLFVEELISLREPNALVRELENEGYPLTILELHGFHNISKAQYAEGVTYVDLLVQNYNHLSLALTANESDK